MTVDKIKECIINGSFCSSKFRAYKKKNNIIISPKEAFLILHDIKEPICYCGNFLKFKSFNVGFSTYCSAKCANKCKIKIEKQKQSYDSKSEEERNEIVEKIKNTYKNKTAKEKKFISYKANITKQNKTTEEKELTKKKREKTNIIKYGYANHMQNKEISKKSVDTQIKLYGGCFNPTKTKATNLEKYGVEYPIQNIDVKLKYSKKLREKFNGNKNKISGVIYFLKMNELIKIGVSEKNNFDKRYKKLCKSYNYNMQIVNIIESDDIYRLEKYYHNLFNKYNVILQTGEGKTEWFTTEIMTMTKS